MGDGSVDMYIYIYIYIYVKIHRGIHLRSVYFTACYTLKNRMKERQRMDVCGHCLQVSVKWTYFMGLKNPRGSFLSLFHLFIWPVCKSGCIRLPVIPVARGIGGWGWESDQGRTQGAWAPWLRKAGSWLTLPGRRRTWKPDDKVLKVFTPCLEWHRPCPLVLEAESSSLRLDSGAMDRH